MYNNNLIVAVKKSNGDTLRESSLETISSDSFFPNKKSTIYLPFDSEYKLFIWNPAPYRALMSITIDGTNVLGGHQLVIEAQSEQILERFVLDSDLNKGNKFKFVSLQDKAVQNPQEPKNGLVEIKCRWESYFPSSTIYIPTVSVKPWDDDSKTDGIGVKDLHWNTVTDQHLFGVTYTSGDKHSINTSGNVGAESPGSSAKLDISGTISIQNNAVNCVAQEQKGATVEGSQSDQRFRLTSIGSLQYGETTIQFQILAPKSESQPITVKATRNKYCTVCGTKLPKVAKYCLSCGIAQSML